MFSYLSYWSELDGIGEKVEQDLVKLQNGDGVGLGERGRGTANLLILQIDARRRHNQGEEDTEYLCC